MEKVCNYFRALKRAALFSPHTHQAESSKCAQLAEQNTNIAQRCSDYGYIRESGSVVMDDIASDLVNNEDFNEVYLGMGGGERKN